MVKGEKLGAVNHGDAEGSKFFCIHLLPNPIWKSVAQHRLYVNQSVHWWMASLINLKTCGEDKLATNTRQQTRKSVSQKLTSQDSCFYQSCSDKGVRGKSLTPEEPTKKGEKPWADNHGTTNWMPSPKVKNVWLQVTNNNHAVDKRADQPDWLCRHKPDTKHEKVEL